MVLDVRSVIEKLEYYMVKYLIDRKIYFILILNKSVKGVWKYVKTCARNN